MFIINSLHIFVLSFENSEKRFSALQLVNTLGLLKQGLLCFRKCTAVISFTNESNISRVYESSTDHGEQYHGLYLYLGTAVTYCWLTVMKLWVDSGDGWRVGAVVVSCKLYDASFRALHGNNWLSDVVMVKLIHFHS